MASDRERKNKSPAGRTTLPVTVMQVKMCCSKCEEKAREEAEEVQGVVSVITDQRNSKVSVYGPADPQTLLKKMRRHLDKHAMFWTSESGQETAPPILFPVERYEERGNSNKSVHVVPRGVDNDHDHGHVMKVERAHVIPGSPTKQQLYSELPRIVPLETRDGRASPRDHMPSQLERDMMDVRIRDSPGQHGPPPPPPSPQREVVFIPVDAKDGTPVDPRSVRNVEPMPIPRNVGAGGGDPRPPLYGPTRDPMELRAVPEGLVPIRTVARDPRDYQVPIEPRGVEYRAVSPRSNYGPRESDYRSPREAGYRSPREAGYRSPREADYQRSRESDYRSPRDTDVSNPRGSDYRSPREADYRSPREADHQGPREATYLPRSPREADYGPRSPREAGYRAPGHGEGNYGPRSPREADYRAQGFREGDYGPRSPRETTDYRPRSPGRGDYGTRSSTHGGDYNGPRRSPRTSPGPVLDRELSFNNYGPRDPHGIVEGPREYRPVDPREADAFEFSGARDPQDYVLRSPRGGEGGDYPIGYGGTGSAPREPRVLLDVKDVRGGEYQREAYEPRDYYRSGEIDPHSRQKQLQQPVSQYSEFRKGEADLRDYQPKDTYFGDYRPSQSYQPGSLSSQERDIEPVTNPNYMKHIS